jgi:hypothetical protein
MIEKGLFDLLDRHNEIMRRQNEIIQQMLDIMPKPAGKATKVLETALTIIGIFGVVGVADIIKKWVTGG